MNPLRQAERVAQEIWGALPLEIAIELDRKWLSERIAIAITDAVDDALHAENIMNCQKCGVEMPIRDANWTVSITDGAIIEKVFCPSCL